MAFGLDGEPVRELGDRRQQLVVHRARGGDVHRGREAVVRALAAIDVVVGMHRRLAAAALPGELVGASGDDLVDVHVGLRAAAGLPHHERKLRVMTSGEDLVGRLFDPLGELPGELAAAGVHARRRLLDQRECMDDGERHAFVADGEVEQRALGLCAPVGLGGDFDRAEAVGFGAGHVRPPRAGWREIPDPGRRTPPEPLLFRGTPRGSMWPVPVQSATGAPSCSCSMPRSPSPSSIARCRSCAPTSM